MPLTNDLVTISCPSCHRSLPPAAANCHFCGASLANVARPQPQAKKSQGRRTESWIVALYYIVASYWLLSGAYGIYDGLVAYAKLAQENIPGLAFIPIIGIGISAIGAILGIGLMLRWELARGIVNVFCWFRIAMSALGLYSTVMMFAILPPMLLVLSLLFGVLDIALAALQIWLISETDSYGW